MTTGQRNCKSESSDIINKAEEALRFSKIERKIQTSSQRQKKYVFSQLKTSVGLHYWYTQSYQSCKRACY